MLTLQTVEAALAISAISLTLAKSHVTEGLRSRLDRQGPVMLAKLASCPYCVSHWIAAVVALWLPQTGFIGYAISVFALVAMAAVLMGLAIKLLHMGQHELETLKSMVNELEDENDELRMSLSDIAAGED